MWLDHIRLHDHDDRRALARLVDEYDRYAISLANRLYRDREPREDLEQVAREALVVALLRFEPDRGLPFPSYATPTIVGAIRRHYRDRGWLVRVPRSTHELTVATHATTERLVIELGRTPSLVELAGALDVEVDDLIAAQDAVYARNVTSLDAAPSANDDPLEDRIGSDDPRISKLENHLALSSALRSIDAQGRQLLLLYYVEECTQSEIAERLGISQMQVSRLLANVLRRLRSRVGQP